MLHYSHRKVKNHLKGENIMKRTTFSCADGKKLYRARRVSAAKKKETESKKQVTWLWALWGSHFAA